MSTHKPNNKAKVTKHKNSAKQGAKQHKTATNPKKHTKTHKTATQNSHQKKHNKVAKQVQKQPKHTQKSKEETFMLDKQLEESRQIAEKLKNKTFTQHIYTKVGGNASDILKVLIKTQKTDEDIATQLNMKVNDVRRALNIMNGYSIVKYDVNKDSKGWLMFKWKINNEKLEDYISNTEKELTAEAEPELPGDCNDFFICKKCYTNQKIVLPFETAFDSGFNCDNCGKPYAILNRSEAVELFKTSQE